eukprot:352179-Chlamydomonas_euryale.AAC.6
MPRQDLVSEGALTKSSRGKAPWQARIKARCLDKVESRQGALTKSSPGKVPCQRQVKARCLVSVKSKQGALAASSQSKVPWQRQVKARCLGKLEPSHNLGSQGKPRMLVSSQGVLAVPGTLLAAESTAHARMHTGRLKLWSMRPRWVRAAGAQRPHLACHLWPRCHDDHREALMCRGQHRPLLALAGPAGCQAPALEILPRGWHPSCSTTVKLRCRCRRRGCHCRRRLACPPRRPLHRSLRAAMRSDGCVSHTRPARARTRPATRRSMAVCATRHWKSRPSRRTR